jgi:hypothetical protein
MAFADGDRPRVGGRMGRIALLGAMYVGYQVAIRVLEDIMVSLYYYISSERLLTIRAQCRERCARSDARIYIR